MGTVTYPTLEHVAMQARPYPAHLLEGCETGLCLFAAAFLGHNDAIHMAEAGMRVNCIDTDEARLNEMKQLYPDSWEWGVYDAWAYAEFAWKAGASFDVVSVDTFTGDAMRRSLDTLYLWCALARKAVTATITIDATYIPPDGWTDSLYHRAGDVYWLVLERE